MLARNIALCIAIYLRLYSTQDIILVHNTCSYTRPNNILFTCFLRSTAVYNFP